MPTFLSRTSLYISLGVLSCGAVATALIAQVSAGAALPNLQIEEVDILPTRSANQLNVADISVVISNTGRVKAPSSFLTVVPTREVFSAPSVDAYDMKIVPYITTVGPFAIAGRHEIQVCVDRENKIAESNENDNCSSAWINEPAAGANISGFHSDTQIGTTYNPSFFMGMLDVTGITSTPGTLANGDKLKWSYTIKNNASANIPRAKVTAGYAKSNYDSPITVLLDSHDLTDVTIGKTYSFQTPLSLKPAGDAKEFIVCIDLMPQQYCIPQRTWYGGDAESSSSSSRASSLPLKEAAPSTFKKNAVTIPDDCDQLDLFLTSMQDKFDALSEKIEAFVAKMSKGKQTAASKKELQAGLAALQKEAKDLAALQERAQEKFDAKCWDNDDSQSTDDESSGEE
jgi:hypothetical protein